MQRVIFAIVMASSLLSLLLLGYFFASYKTEHSARSSSSSLLENNLGLASLRLDRPSSETSTYAFAPALKNAAVPTNKWWSSALLSPWPNILFNLPWASKISAAGLQVGIPSVQATSDEIAAPFAADISINISSGSLKKSVVSAYDDLSVSLDLYDSSGSSPFTVHLVKGIPYEFVDYSKQLSITSADKNMRIQKLNDGRTSIGVRAGTQLYEVIAPKDAKISGTGALVQVSPSASHGSLAIMAIPVGASAQNIVELEDASKNEVTGGSVSYSVNATSVTTKLKWALKKGSTNYVILPHQMAGGAGGSSLGTFNTVRGAAMVAPGNEFSYTLDTPQYLDSLPLPAQDTFFDRNRLEKYLADAEAGLSTPASTSYNGGKELFRLANLLEISHAAGSRTESSFRKQLHEQLTDWLTYSPGENSKYFSYDSHIHGLVAVTPEYGSEQFNDHHFHYGYFIYASAVLGRYDPAFVKDYGKAVDLIVSDIASTDRNDTAFPYLRVFDAYEGHSWADGFGKFADGNNQESVSEAANAWYAMMLWGRVSKNATIEQAGQWLYTNETQAALTYYYQDKKLNPFPRDYTHHQISLVWGGKDDWSTWFNAAPEAKHAILMLPISGGSFYLGDGTNMKDDLAALNTELKGKAPTMFNDILLMAQALSDPVAAQSKFNDSLAIDNSNSLAFTYYWLGLSGQKEAMLQKGNAK